MSVSDKSSPWKKERDRAIAALSNAFAIASAGIAALKTVEEVLPAAARNVEEASRSLTEHFMVLTENYSGQNQANHHAVSEAIKGVTENMQFQDRNTQVSENTVHIMERCRGLLEDVKSSISVLFTSQPEAENNISAAVENILSVVQLHDIRNSFTQTLNDMQITYNDESTVFGKISSADIELF